MSAKFSGKKLKRFRNQKNLTQECLAEMADLSVRQIVAVETGKSSNPHASTLYRIARALDVTMEALMEVSEEIGGDSIS